MSNSNGVKPLDEQTKRQNRRVISGLVLLFVVPVILAYTAFYMGWFTQATKNKGVLLESPYPRFEQFAWFNTEGEPLHFKNFETQWWWIYFPKSNHCDAECDLNMEFLSRTHQGLGKRIEKLTRLAVFPSEINHSDPLQKPEQLQLARGNGQAHIGNGVALELGKIYAMDVHGNIFMQYEPVTSEEEARMKAKDLRDDIVRAMRNTGL
ncbi:MAG: hypothetical protein HWE16_00210 [Gammaproteobacteria bacterium]|nr:hypothetical protein [Gammaproteobacteria bacterium]